MPAVSDNSSSSRVSLIFCVIAWLVFAFACEQLLVNLAQKRMPIHHLLSADTFYLPAVYQDLFVRHIPLNGWKTTAAPFVFPDFALVALSLLLTGNRVATALLLNGFLQVLLTIGLFYLLLRKLYPRARGGVWLVLAGIFVTVLASRFMAFGVYYQVFITSYHYGAFLAQLMVLVLVISLLRHRHAGRHLLLFLICLATTVSDLIFLSSVVVPCLAVLAVFLLIPGRRISALFTGLNIICGTALGYLLFTNIDQFDHYVMTRQYQLDRLPAFFSSLHQYTHYLQDPTFVFTLAAVIAWLFINLALAIRLLTSPAGRNQPGRLFFALFCVIMPFAQAAAMVVAGYDRFYHFDLSTLCRYLIPFFLMPIFGWALYFSAWCRKPRRLGRWLTASALSATILFTLSLNHDFSQPMLDYYPDYVRWLDEQKDLYQLETGLSSYWFAKYVTLLSRNDLHLLQVHTNFRLSLWVNNLQWYLGKENFPRINFLFSSGEEFQYHYLVRRFGPPDRTLAFDKRTLYIYNQPYHHFQHFLKHEPYIVSQLFRLKEHAVLELPGAELQGRIGRTAGSARAADGNAGALVHMRFPGLPAGDYRLSLRYQAQAAGSSASVAVPTRSGLLAQRGLAANNAGEATLNFTLTQDSQDLLFRVYTSGEGACQVQDMVLQKL